MTLFRGKDIKYFIQLPNKVSCLNKLDSSSVWEQCQKVPTADVSGEGTHGLA